MTWLQKSSVTIGAALFLSSVPFSGHAYVVTINSGTKSIYLQVGTGTTSGSGGSITGGNNATVNTVSVTIPAASVGAGSVAMTTNSTVTKSPYDAFVFCSVPSQVYIGGYYRTPGTGANATLTVASPANLVSGSDTLSFSTISWVSGGNGDATPTVPSGTFVAGTVQTLLSIARNPWFESCMQFNYANSTVVAAGTFTGRVTYTLTSP